MTAESLVPKEMSDFEIWSCIEDFKMAAQNAIKAGFDGVEIHGANGYHIDQFSQDTVNHRTDSWGGSVEKRSRCAIEVARAVTGAIGSNEVGMRLSPWSTFQGMRMQTYAAARQFSHIVRGLKGLDMSYLHLVESRVNNNDQGPVFAADGYDGARARSAVDDEYKGRNALVVFGRYFVSTPDLVYRLQHGIEPNMYDRATFYTPVQAEGYTDYPYSKEYLASVKA
ncbi:hypothetical protein ACHAQH_002733 [Verticillium albo-atrum]